MQSQPVTTQQMASFIYDLVCCIQLFFGIYLSSVCFLSSKSDSDSSRCEVALMTLKGSIQDILQSPHCAANCLQFIHSRSSHVQITCITLGMSHHDMQHMCRMVQRDSSAIKADRLEITFILALFHWPKPLTNVGGEEPEYSDNPPYPS